jgi:hypothetical protein
MITDRPQEKYLQFFLRCTSCNVVFLNQSIYTALYMEIDIISVTISLTHKTACPIRRPSKNNIFIMYNTILI